YFDNLKRVDVDVEGVGRSGAFVIERPLFSIAKCHGLVDLATELLVVDRVHRRRIRRVRSAGPWRSGPEAQIPAHRDLAGINVIQESRHSGKLWRRWGRHRVREAAIIGDLCGQEEAARQGEL